MTDVKGMTSMTDVTGMTVDTQIDLPHTDVTAAINRLPHHSHRVAAVCAAVLLTTSLFALPPRSAEATTYDYTAGHGDIGLASGLGLRFFLKFGGDAEATGLTSEQLIAGQPGGEAGEWSLASFVTVVPQSVQIPRPDGAEWNFLGTEAGEPVWIFSQQGQLGVPFLGFDTEKIGGTGTYTLSNVTVRPTGGEVSLFQFGGFAPDAVFWSTADAGVDAVTVPAGTHVHYAFAFTKPGYYELPLVGTVSGLFGQANGTLAFQVVPEPSTWALAAMGLLAAGLVGRRRFLGKRAPWPKISGV